MSALEKVKGYLAELGYAITSENTAEEIVVIDDESQGIKNLIIDCEAPILILEQHIFNLKNADAAVYKRLLQINRTLVHGAFVLDDSGERVLFRDTLQLANLDLNELEGSINALSLAMAEHAQELIKFATV
ncbi:MAG: YbjN domain-containing protein [Deltaproteobacteria bacterium]|nr:YbjN domain-containing protein [Deltaproteobacteria bacterium]